MTSVQEHAHALLADQQVDCVVGYERGTLGKPRPAFITQPNEAERLIWDKHCTHNLTVYLHDLLKEPNAKVGVVVKACDSKAINVLLAEHKFRREQVVVIGVVCEGVYADPANGGALQEKCHTCAQRVPYIVDLLVGEEIDAVLSQVEEDVPSIEELELLSPSERFAYWASQFDRCIRCYACRQACPMCDCPTCLYERNDSLWVGMGSSMQEKRSFHLGRAYHLAGRCVGCNECEQVCPMGIPISKLNQIMAAEMEQRFAFQAGIEAVPSPITTLLRSTEVIG